MCVLYMYLQMSKCLGRTDTGLRPVPCLAKYEGKTSGSFIKISACLGEWTFCVN